MRKLVIFSFLLFSSALLSAQEKIQKQPEPKQQQEQTDKEQETDTVEIPLHANAQLIAKFKGLQISGMAVTPEKQLYYCFPRLQKGLRYSLVRVSQTRGNLAYPDDSWNSWEIGDDPSGSKFIGVESLDCFRNKLYVLDSRSVNYQKPLDAPRIFVFDMENAKYTETYILPNDVYYPDSYLSNMIIDRGNKRIYIADSGHAGLIILNLRNGKCSRVLNDHYSTTAETNHLTFGENHWNKRVNVAGLAIDRQRGILYYHALCGYTLYGISTHALIKLTGKELEQHVKKIAKTSATEGMYFDKKRDNLIFSDLEHQEIRYIKPGKEDSSHLLLNGEFVQWAGTFKGRKYDLYYVNSKRNEVNDDNLKDTVFTVYKVDLPGK